MKFRAKPGKNSKHRYYAEASVAFRSEHKSILVNENTQRNTSYEYSHFFQNVTYYDSKRSRGSLRLPTSAF